MKYKAQVVGIIILAAIGGAFYGTWHFFFQELFEGYKQDSALKNSLENTLKQMEDNFSGYKPELLIDEWQGMVQPWRSAREDRAKFFNFGGWYDIDIKQDDDRILKFWYTEESNAMLMELYKKVYEKMGGYDRFPYDLRGMLNVAKEEDWTGQNVTQEQIDLALRTLQFGINLSEYLLKAEISSLSNVVLWPRRFPEAHQKMLGLQTVGLRFTMTARDLVRFLEALRQETRYFSVDAIRVIYPYISYAGEPQLDVRLLLTQANYRAPQDEGTPGTPGVGAAPGATFGAGGAPMVIPPREIDPERMRRQQEPGPLGRFWRWFKRTVLYMN